MAKCKKKHTNSFLQFRNDNIQPGLTMKYYSKICGLGWKNTPISQQIKYYHAAAKDAVEKNPGNDFTELSFEQFGSIAFVNATPKRKNIADEGEIMFETYTQNTDYIFNGIPPQNKTKSILDNDSGDYPKKP